MREGGSTGPFKGFPHTQKVEGEASPGKLPEDIYPFTLRGSTVFSTALLLPNEGSSIGSDGAAGTMGEKEEFYAGLKGTTPLEVATLLSVLLVSYWCRLSLSTTKNEFLWDCLVYLSAIVVSFNTENAATQVVLVLGCKALLNTFLLPLLRDEQHVSTNGRAADSIKTWVRMQRKPFVATYRGMMMLSTCCSILAVDFQIFPRKFAKTENFGFSLMDTGVGSLIISNGLVSSIRSKSSKGSLLSSLLPAIPLVFLGGARCWTVKSTGYHEHVSEYGVHWNFFLTLAGVHIGFVLLQQCSWLLQRRSPSTPTLCVAGFLVAAVYEYGLAQGLEEWVDTAPRTDLVSANKEGIASLAGFFALYLVSAGIGKWLFPVTGSIHSFETWKKRGKDLVMFTCVMAVASYIWITTSEKLPSRKLANLSYCLWVLFLNMVLLSGYLMVDLIYCPSAPGIIVDAINFNQLAVFLVANVLTGVINLSMDTLHTSDLIAYNIVCGYLLIVVGLAVQLRRRNILLKFW